LPKNLYNRKRKRETADGWREKSQKITKFSLIFNKNSMIFNKKSNVRHALVRNLRMAELFFWTSARNITIQETLISKLYFFLGANSIFKYQCTYTYITSTSHGLRISSFFLQDRDPPHNEWRWQWK